MESSRCVMLCKMILSIECEDEILTLSCGALTKRFQDLINLDNCVITLLLN